MSSNDCSLTAVRDELDNLIKSLGIKKTTYYLCKEGLIDNEASAVILSMVDVRADIAQLTLFQKLSFGLAKGSIINTLKQFLNAWKVEGQYGCENEVCTCIKQRYEIFTQRIAFQITDLQHVLLLCNSTVEALQMYDQGSNEVRTLNNPGSLEYIFHCVFAPFAQEDILMILYAVGWLSEFDVNEIRATGGITTQETFIKKLTPHLVDIKIMMKYSTAVQRRHQEEHFEERNFYRSKIIGHWKYLTENLLPVSIIDDLIQEEFIDEAPDLTETNRRKTVYLVLTSIVRKIEDEAGFNKFINILEKNNHFIAETLITEFEVKDWASKVLNKEDCIYKLQENKDLLIKEMKPEQIVDDFLVGFICDLDDHEGICCAYNHKSKMATRLVKMVVKEVEKGSYPCLLQALKSTLVDRTYRYITEKLESSKSPTSPSKEEKSISIEPQNRILYTSNPDIPSHGGKLTLVCQSDNKEQIEELVKDGVQFIGKLFFSLFHAVAICVNSGSVIVQLLSFSGDFKNKVEESIQNGGMDYLLNELFNDQEIKYSLSPGEYMVDVTVQEDNVNYLREQDDDAKRKVNPSNIVVANRSLLIEELDPLSFLPAFAKKGFTCFEDLGLQSILLRKARTEKFLEVLESGTEELIEVFLDILREQNRAYVLKCLEMSTTFENIDVSLLTRNILKYVSHVVDEVNINDLKNIFADRNILRDELFERIEERFPDNKHGRIVWLLKEIIHDGENAIFTLVESLYRSGNEKLVEKLLNGTQIGIEKNEEDEFPMREFLEDIEIREYQTDLLRKGLIFSGTYKIIVNIPGQECLLKTILLLDVGVSMKGEGMEELQSTVADFLTGQEFVNEYCDLKEHVAVVTFGRRPELKLHFRNDCFLVKSLIKYLSTSNEQSSLIPALELCKSLLMPGLSEETTVIRKSRKPTFYPRIILVSDGHFTPNMFIDVRGREASSEAAINSEVLELCEFFKQRKVEIKCIPVGHYDKIPVVEMVGRYPKDPLHFLAKETGGSVVFKEFVDQLGSERLNRLNRFIDEELAVLFEGLFEPSPLIKVAQQAVEKKITNVYQVMGMARDEGIEEVCPTALAGLLMALRKRKEEEADDDDLDD